MVEAVSKSWFAVFNNPEKHGYTGTPEEILKRLHDEWCAAGDSRVGAWAYCILHYNGHYPVYDEDGELLRYELAKTDEEKAKVPEDLHHVHMVLEDSKAMRFSFIKNTYAKGAHFEGTKGSKKQAEDYISKTGIYDEIRAKLNGEPWEEIIGSVLFHGDIKGRQGQSEDFVTIEKLVRVDRMKPNQIFRLGARFRKHEHIVLGECLQFVVDNTPVKRDIDTIWHMGPSRSGKSYTRVKLVEEYGEDEVFVLGKYDERGMFDGYWGQKILVIEDFKGGIPFQTLLTWLDGYKNTLPARQRDRVSVWTQVHITSVYHPTQLYKKMVSSWDQVNDPMEQLINRISEIQYHYRTGPLYSSNPEDYHVISFPRTATEKEILLTVQNRLQNLYDASKFEEITGVENLPF